MQVQRRCMLPGNGQATQPDRGRVHTAAPEVALVALASAGARGGQAASPSYNLGVLDDPADHVGAPVAELRMPVQLSRKEFVAALALSGLNAEDLNALSAEDVGRQVAATVLVEGLSVVQREAVHGWGPEVPAAFLAGCERWVDELLTGQPATAEPAATAGTDRAARDLVDVDAAGW